MIKDIYPYLGGELYAIGKKILDQQKDKLFIEEIRIRANKPLLLKINGRDRWVTPQGSFTNYPDQVFYPSLKDIKLTLEKMSSYSLYAYEETMKAGFLTISGGHRVGVCGEIVMKSGQVQTIKNISSLHIRVTKEVLGASKKIWSLFANGPKNILIIGAPGKGKTTILRDLIRYLGASYTLGVVDERSEIAGGYQGNTSFDLGIKTDVLQNVSKEKGLSMLLRSMSPEILAVDEIGDSREVEVLKKAGFGGVNIVATIHGDSLTSVLQKNDKGFEKIFDYFVLVEKVGCISTIYNQKGQAILSTRSMERGANH